MLICIRVKDESIAALSLLLLQEVLREERMEAQIRKTEDPPAQTALLITDSASFGAVSPERVLRTGRGGEGLPFPFLREEFFARVRRILCAFSVPEPAPRHICLPRCAPCLLSETEWALFSLLRQNAEGVSAKELALALWQDADRAGSLPVYVYHLRRKLEADGKRRLFSLRGKGYRVEAGDVLMGGDVC